jgi:hypothetical protein
MIRVKWKCPICNGKNTDDYEEVTLLICIHCDSEVEWGDVLTDEQRKAFDRDL